MNRLRVKLSVVVGIIALVAAGSTLRSATQNEPGLKELTQRQIEIARRAFDDAERTLASPPSGEDFQARTGVVERYADWSRRWMEAQIEETQAGASHREDRAARAAAIQAHLARQEKGYKLLREQIQVVGSSVSQLHLDRLEYEILEAKVDLIKNQTQGTE